MHHSWGRRGSRSRAEGWGSGLAAVLPWLARSRCSAWPEGATVGAGACGGGSGSPADSSGTLLALGGLPSAVGTCGAHRISLLGHPGQGSRGAVGSGGAALLAQLCSLTCPSPVGGGLTLLPQAQAALRRGPSQSPGMGLGAQGRLHGKASGSCAPYQESAVLGRHRRVGGQRRAAGQQGGPERLCPELVQVTRPETLAPSSSLGATAPCTWTSCPGCRLTPREQGRRGGGLPLPPAPLFQPVPARDPRGDYSRAPMLQAEGSWDTDPQTTLESGVPKGVVSPCGL